MRQPKEVIAQRESSGSYTAQNGQYYGRYQLSLSYLNGDLSPENQEKVADAYVSGRYGSWSVASCFLNANGYIKRRKSDIFRLFSFVFEIFHWFT